LLSNNEEKTAIGQEDNERKNEDTKEAEKPTYMPNTDFTFLRLRREHLKYSP
jgi:hypothetical protein